MVLGPGWADLGEETHGQTRPQMDKRRKETHLPGEAGTPATCEVLRSGIPGGRQAEGANLRQGKECERKGRPGRVPTWVTDVPHEAWHGKG